MTIDNEGIDHNEISKILKEGAENYDSLSNKVDDDYDKLISRIILIEKMHKYGSTGKEKKFKEITDEIESFINKED